MDKIKRIRLLEKYGITNVNHRAWSFVNHEKRIVFFGAWKNLTEKHRAMILSKDWEEEVDGTIKGNYTTACRHIELIESGYDLYIFIQEGKHLDNGNSKLDVVYNNIEKAELVRINDEWYAYRGGSYNHPDEEQPKNVKFDFYEGDRKLVAVNAYERNKEAREQCIRIHGAICKGCGFDFEQTYGEHGKGFIHVHHLFPLYMINKRYKINPETDLVPLCPNCHAMVHRFKDNELDLETLKKIILSCKK